MRLIVVLLLIMPVFLFSQNCPEGDKYYPKCDDRGNWLKCMDGYADGWEGKSKVCICEKMPLYKNHPAIKALQAKNAQQDRQIKGLQKSDATQTADINDLKPRVETLEKEMKGVKGDLAIRPKEISFKEPEKITEKSVEKPDPTKKVDPSLGPPREAPKVVVPAEPSFFVEPEIGLFATKTNSPEFNSKWLYVGEVGVRLVLEPHKWHGFGIFAHPKYSFGLNKSFIPESDGSAYVQQLENKSGALVDVCISYKPIKYTEVFGGYAFSLSKGTEHHSGFLAGLESGWDFNSGRQSLQLRAQLGILYKHDLSFFGGVVARLPIKHKPK